MISQRYKLIFDKSKFYSVYFYKLAENIFILKSDEIKTSIINQCILFNKR